MSHYGVDLCEHSQLGPSCPEWKPSAQGSLVISNQQSCSAPSSQSGPLATLLNKPMAATSVAFRSYAGDILPPFV